MGATKKAQFLFAVLRLRTNPPNEFQDSQRANPVSAIQSYEKEMSA